jgi:predicted RNA-binding Zn-ribbon protein involved in translation (DUF1610 family)
MALPSLIGHVKLPRYATYEEHGAGLDRCPNCHNTRIGKTPRRKAGPAMFHCRKCGFLANLDQINHMHWMLGQRGA